MGAGPLGNSPLRGPDRDAPGRRQTGSRLKVWPSHRFCEPIKREVASIVLFVASTNKFIICYTFILLTWKFQRQRLALLLSNFNEIMIILFTYTALFIQGFLSALQICTKPPKRQR